MLGEFLRSGKMEEVEELVSSIVISKFCGVNCSMLCMGSVGQYCSTFCTLSRKCK